MSFVNTLNKTLQDVKTTCTIQAAEASPLTNGLTARCMSLRFPNPCDAYKCRELAYAEGDKNISNVVDMLIRLTAKYTSRYGSDIYYTLHELYRAVEETGEPMCRILSFREMGVSSKPAGFDAKGNLFIYVHETKQCDEFRHEAYQHWLLAVAPSEDGNSVSIILTHCEPSRYHWNDVPETSEDD